MRPWRTTMRPEDRGSSDLAGFDDRRDRPGHAGPAAERARRRTKPIARAKRSQLCRMTRRSDPANGEHARRRSLEPSIPTGILVPSRAWSRGRSPKRTQQPILISRDSGTNAIDDWDPEQVQRRRAKRSQPDGAKRSQPDGAERSHEYQDCSHIAEIWDDEGCKEYPGGGRGAGTNPIATRRTKPALPNRAAIGIVGNTRAIGGAGSGAPDDPG